MNSRDGPMLLVQKARDPDPGPDPCCGFFRQSRQVGRTPRMATTGDDGVFRRFRGRCHPSPVRIVDFGAFDSRSRDSGHVVAWSVSKMNPGGRRGQQTPKTAQCALSASRRAHESVDSGWGKVRAPRLNDTARFTTDNAKKAQFCFSSPAQPNSDVTWTLPVAAAQTSGSCPSTSWAVPERRRTSAS